MISYILTDIEGTTTPISFVHDVLFPYAYERLPKFVAINYGRPEVNAAIRDTAATVLAEEKKTINNDEAVQVLLAWIKQDRKHPALKQLQGLIWDEGYKSAAYTSVIYDDVVPNIKSWIAGGKIIGIYSSGSVHAQQLLFGHTPAGNINPLICHYFDTGVGGKKEKTSYQNIVNILKIPATSILFLSDVEEELTAAAGAGLNVIQLVRPGTVPSKIHPTCTTFDEVSLKIEYI